MSDDKYAKYRAAAAQFVDTDDDNRRRILSENPAPVNTFSLSVPADEDWALHTALRRILRGIAGEPVEESDGTTAEPAPSAGARRGRQGRGGRRGCRSRDLSPMPFFMSARQNRAAQRPQSEVRQSYRPADCD